MLAILRTSRMRDNFTKETWLQDKFSNANSLLPTLDGPKCRRRSVYAFIPSLDSVLLRNGWLPTPVGPQIPPRHTHSILSEQQQILCMMMCKNKHENIYSQMVVAYQAKYLPPMLFHIFDNTPSVACYVISIIHICHVHVLVVYRPMCP